MKKIIKNLLKIQYVWLLFALQTPFASASYERFEDAEVSKSVTKLRVGHSVYIDQHVGLLLILLEEQGQIIKEYAAQMQCKNMRSSIEYAITLSPLIGNDLDSDSSADGKKTFFLSTQDRSHPKRTNYFLKNCINELLKINKFTLNSNAFEIEIDPDPHTEEIQPTKFFTQPTPKTQFFYLPAKVLLETSDEESNEDSSNESNKYHTFRSLIENIGDRYLNRDH